MEETKGLSSVQGFRFSAIQCGIRYEGRLDFCAIVCDYPCNASGVFTTNKVFAAPVRLCRERIHGTLRAILVNATNANACTGDEGYQNTVRLVSSLEKSLGLEPASVLMASTGIIGRQLPVDRMDAAIPAIAQGLDAAAGSTIARAIMTTDTKPKETAHSFTTSKGTFTVAGTAKGSGMIAPNMATMLSFIITDAHIEKNDLDRIFRDAADRTFNSLTIDGDMSTNDTCLMLSPKNGEAIRSESDLKAFADALMHVCRDLAYMLVKDAEGGTKCVTVTVNGARTSDDAKKCARSVAQSLLLKTAFFGGDPNWGRVACAAGYSGVAFEQEKLCIRFDATSLLLNGTPQKVEPSVLADIMKNPEFTVTVDLGSGSETWSFLTSDISYDYVKINAEYST
jgi:glutamate N-acetyltransferase/amino-acid N-acetyltransferase